MPQKKLPDRVRDAIRLKHYSIRTDQAHVSWIKRYALLPRQAQGRRPRRPLIRGEGCAAQVSLARGLSGRGPGQASCRQFASPRPTGT